jgi:putative Mn2+ efflux pump MntP
VDLHLNDLAVAVGLGMDAMSVCAAVGVRWHGPRQKFRLAWHMGLFQFLMPIAGWFVGQEVAGSLRGVARYLAAALVFGVGAKMLYEAVRSRPGAVAERVEHSAEAHRPACGDPTRGWSLLVLSVATSLDALVVGFSLGLRGSEIWHVSVIIGIVAAAMSLAGVILGQYVGRAIGRGAEFAGALVLMGLGVSFLWL